MELSAREKLRRALAEAFDEGLTGLIFALLLSVCVVGVANHAPFLKDHRVPFLQVIEDHGVDATMRLRASMYPLERLKLERPPVRAPAGYVFVDLDEATCLDVESKDARCESRSPASAATAARVANALLTAKPRVIVIDARLWDFDPNAPIPDEVRRLRDNPAAGNIPVLATAPATPSTDRDTASIDWSQIPRDLPGGFIRFAPALMWPEGSDGIARRYPAEVCADVTDHDRNLLPSKTSVDTLPRLAARYAMARGGMAEVDPVAARVDGRSPQACGKSRGAEGPRTLFTLAADLPEQIDAKQHRSAFYNVFQSSEVARLGPDEKAQLVLDPSQIDDRVVVIGFSGIGGLDRHATPLGEMSGAEMIVNATRSFAVPAAVGPEHHLMWALWREITVAFFASLPFFLFWLLKAGMWEWAGNVPTSRFGAAVVTLLAFLLTVLVSAFVSVASVSTFWSASLAHGEPVDALTPVVVLMLEAFNHAATFVINRVSIGVACLRKAGLAWLQRKFRRPDDVVSVIVTEVDVAEIDLVIEVQRVAHEQAE